ncbi:hypothetical protein D3C81_819650 [compost metagenome]
MRARLDVVDLFATHGGRGRDLTIQCVQAMAQGDDQVFGDRWCAGQLAGNERVKVMQKLACLPGLGVHVVERVERQCQCVGAVIMVPGAAIAAVVQPHPAKLSLQVGAFGQGCLLLVVQQAASGERIFVELGALFAFQACNGQAVILAEGVDQPQGAQVLIGHVLGRVVDELGHRVGAAQLQGVIGLPGTFEHAEHAAAMVVAHHVVECRPLTLGRFRGGGRRYFQCLDPVRKFGGQFK